MLLHFLKREQLIWNIAFLRVCKNDGIIPRGLRCQDKLSNTHPCAESKALARRHSFQYLQVLIDVLYKKLYRINSYAINGPLSYRDDWNLQKARLNLFRIKLRKLISLRSETGKFHSCEKTDICGFTNLSKKTFSQSELDILNQGPSYAPPKGAISQSENLKYQTNLDCLIRKLHIPKQDYRIQELSGTVKRILSEMSKHNKNNKQSYEKNLICNLKKQDVIFVPSDKSKKLVAMDIDQYDSLMEEQVQLNGFVETKFLQPASIQNTFNKKLNSIAKKYPDLLRMFSKCLCSEPLPSKLKVLPKDHKAGSLKTRPIVAAVDAPATKLSKFLTGILNPLIRKYVHAHIGSTEDFTASIRNITMEESYQFASLDVINLYGSIPVEDHSFPGAISVVSEFFEQHKADSCISAISCDDFAQLLRLCLTSDTIQIQNKAYKSGTGLQMGNNVSCASAIIFMNFIENQILSHFKNIIFWKRYCDDVFLIFHDIEHDNLLSTCNDIHPNIQFTLEIPINNTLSFLDLSLSVYEKKFTYCLFSKPCHSGCAIPWTSHHPKYVIRNILKNEIRRALRNSSDWRNEERSIEIVLNRYLGNGYPKRIILNCIKEVKREKKNRTKHEGNSKLYLSLPFSSNQHTRQIKSVLKKTGLNEFLCVSFSSKTLPSLLRPSKSKTCVYQNCNFCKISCKGELCTTKFCVYEIKCNICLSTYVGETCRTMRSRLKEHLNVTTSLVHRHLITHATTPQHDMISWTIIHNGLLNCNVRRAIEETEIHSRKPNINVQHSSI